MAKSPSNTRRARLAPATLVKSEIATAGPAPPLAWTPPIDIEGGFKTKIGASIVDEFVAGHDASDVLRELVQNEFDAGGEAMAVVFGQTGLTVSGSGRPVDKRGWSRLNVVIGTGRVVGDQADTVVAPKENGIGSKNFGLRSLFLFGDRIHVRSAGRMAVLDLPRLGTQIVEDPSSRGRRGVEIHVPYRHAAFEMLEPFTLERERETFNNMASGVLATLVKLALSGARKGLRDLVLRSERTGRTLTWRQRAEPLRCRIAGVSALRRTGRVSDDDPALRPKALATTFEEIEFSWSATIPAEFAGVNFPSYYRSGAQGVKLGVSLPIKRKRIDLSAVGRFHYPLQAPNSPTGAAISVSAPFKLDADRSALLSNRWNEWLAHQAAQQVATLLTADWLDRFGADAYLALRPNGTAKPEIFATALDQHLRTAPCWPTAAADGALATAAELVAPSRSALGGFLENRRYLAAGLAGNADIVELARTCGARPFTFNSLVRLRCGGEKAALATKCENEANFYFPNYKAELSRPARQLAIGQALAAAGKHLSNPNRLDLKTTASTLAADGTLRPAQDLVVVLDDLWDVCPAPLATRLHRDLIKDKTLAGLCTPFNLDAWIQEACARAVAGRIDETERRSLYDHLLSGEAKLTSRALAAVRCSPVVLNQRGAWVAPEKLALLPTTQARILDPVIDRPAVALSKQTDLVRRLRLRRIMTGADLVAFAARLHERPEQANAFEGLLRAHAALLTPKTVAALASLACLRSAAGGLAAPRDLHVDNPINRICLGEAHLVRSGGGALYRHLGCREQPSPEVMLGVLEAGRLADQPPPQPQIFYPALVMALRAGGRDPNLYADRPILWIDGIYHPPRDVLVGPMIPRWFATAVPVFRGPAQMSAALEALGAASQPRERHWVALFSWPHERRAADQPVSAIERALLRSAYQRRGVAGLPDTLADTVRCLLAGDGRLYALRDLRSGLLVEDDFPVLAAALSRANVKIALADLVDNSRAFFHQLGLQRLTAICGAPRLSVGAAVGAPSWFRSQHADQVLALLRRDDFHLALRELAWAHQRQTEGFRALSVSELRRRLLAITRVEFVAGVQQTYRLAGKTVTVTTDAGALDDRIALAPTRTKFEYEQCLSYALAQLIGALKITDARRLSVVIMPLLFCETRADILAYLERQGLKPPAWVDLAEDDPLVESATLSPQAQALHQMMDDILARAQDAAASPGQAQSQGQVPPSPPAPTPPKPSATLSLPTLDAISANLIVAKDEPLPSRSPWTPGGPGSGGDPWTPRDWNEMQRDRLVGERGEAIVYRMELDRVRALGHAAPETLVIWTSRANPGADHDIQSIDDHGNLIWLEVKSTMGADGRFDWPQREFEKALRDGERYVLVRVYEAHTARPTIKFFANPVQRLAQAQLRLEVGSLRGLVEPKIV